MSQVDDKGAPQRRWSRLWNAARPIDDDHVGKPAELGEYAALLAADRLADAAQAFPDVAAHLASPCESCTEELTELVAMVVAEQGDAGGRGPSYPRPEPRQPPGRGDAGHDIAAPFLELPGGRRFPLTVARLLLGRD